MAQLTYSQNHVRKTNCKYSVILQCVDPPVPCGYYNTNNLSLARRLFEKFKAEEVEKGGGGEFTLTLYKHTLPRDEREFKYWSISAEESEYEYGYVYAVHYENSKVLDRFSYMDLL